MKTPELQTERLLLRAIKIEDMESIYSCWMQDEEISRYMYWKASNDINETKKFIQFELDNLEKDNWNRWIITQSRTGEIIGTCLIFFNEEENNWDISYNLGKKYWRQGYAFEAMRRVMTFAIEDLKIQECIAIHAMENMASGRVIQKLGFQYEKDVPFECNGGEIITTGKYYKFVVK